MGSVFLTVLVIIGVIAITALGGVAAIFVVPIFLVALLVVAGGPIRRFIVERGAPGSSEPTGVPTTGEASYDPIRDPDHPK